MQGPGCRGRARTRRPADQVKWSSAGSAAHVDEGAQGGGHEIVEAAAAGGASRPRSSPLRLPLQLRVRLFHTLVKHELLVSNNVLFNHNVPVKHSRMRRGQVPPAIACNWSSSACKRLQLVRCRQHQLRMCTWSTAPHTSHLLDAVGGPGVGLMVEGLGPAMFGSLLLVNHSVQVKPGLGHCDISNLTEAARCRLHSSGLDTSGR